METLEQLRGRIDSAEGLLDVVRTMKSLSAVYVRQYTDAVQALDGYERNVERGFRILLRAEPGILETPMAPEEGALAALVFGSEHGLCGRFNEDLVDHAVERLESTGFPRESWRVFAVGSRISAVLEGQGIAPVATLELPQSIEALADRARDALLEIEQHQQRDAFARIVLCHQRTDPERTSAPEPRTAVLFPIDPAWLRSLLEEPWPTRVLPTFTAPPAMLLNALVRERVFVLLHAAFADSLAAENAARLRAMQAGESSVEDKLSELSSRYHRRRQESITDELLDVTTAFEVLRDR